MNIDNIGKRQLLLLNKAKDFLDLNTLKHEDELIENPIYYLSSWASSSIGYFKLRYLEKGLKELPAYIKQYINNIISTGFYSECRLNNDIKNYKDYKHIVISWSQQKNFLKDGSLQDPYFNTNSRQASTLWFVISLDGFIPKNIDKNIRVFVNIKRYNFNKYFLLKKLWQWLIKVIRFKATINDSATFKVVYSKILSNILRNKILHDSIKSIIMAYEAQSWQHSLNKTIKNFNSSIETIGYLHSMLSPLPTDFIYRTGAPDKLFVNGIAQKDIFKNYLGWDKKPVYVINSLRYKTDLAQSLAGYIFIPYDFESMDAILYHLEIFLQNISEQLPMLKVRNHPTQVDSSKHRLLISKINILLNKYRSKFFAKEDKKASIFIGATSSIIEALARGIKVIQITSNPIYDSYISIIWKSLHITKITDNIFLYEQKELDAYIRFGSKEDNLQNILDYE